MLYKTVQLGFVAQAAAFSGAMPSKIGQSRVGAIEMAKKSVRARPLEAHRERQGRGKGARRRRGRRECTGARTRR